MPPIASKLGAALVVDDDEFVLSVVARMVRKLGAEVMTAADGQTARRILGEARQFDLVICDLKMPGLDGIELLRDFASLQAGAALILMSSADAKTLRAAEQLAQARQLRILGTMQKPISSAALSQLVARMSQLEKLPLPAHPDSSISVTELRAALQADHIEVYMQPKLGLRSGRLAGVEALARWPQPGGQMVLPNSFVPLAEQSGLADALTQLVVRKALAAQRQWRTQGLDIPVSVNLPIDSLDHLDLPEQLSAEVSRYGAEPDKLILEITESGMMKDLARSLDVVTRLRLRGYRLSIDDFGTGYSSLEQLKRFPFSELKIDRAFVDGAARDPKLRSIAESSIRLARDLNLKTCAEGVETEADYELMRELGCDLVQGYYVARAMPSEELPRWVLAREASVRG